MMGSRPARVGSARAVVPACVVCAALAALVLAGCAGIVYREQTYYPEQTGGRAYRGPVPPGIGTPFRPTDVVFQEQGVILTVSVQNYGESHYLIGPIIPIIPSFWMNGFSPDFDASPITVGLTITSTRGEFSVDYDAFTISSPELGREAFGGGVTRVEVEPDSGAVAYPSEEHVSRYGGSYGTILRFDTGMPDLASFDFEAAGIEVEGEMLEPMRVTFVFDDPLIWGALPHGLRRPPPDGH